MKKLIGHIALFGLPLLLLVIFLPVSRKQKFQELKDDCFNHGIWIHDRIYENEKPIELAFFGSSHTINGIDDKLVDSLTGYRSANLGYCRLGMNLNQVLIEDLLKKKKPKVVFIEVRENEDRYSHPVFPNLAKTSDVLFPYLLFNRDMFFDIRNHLSYKLQLAQDLSMGNYNPSTPSILNFGVASSPDTAKHKNLINVKLRRTKDFKTQNDFSQWFYMKYPKHYLKNIGELLNQKKIRIIFLYLPAYGSPEKAPNLMSEYNRYGDVWIAPKDIFENKDNWFDGDHLNQSGANLYSNWLSQQINSKIK